MKKLIQKVCFAIMLVMLSLTVCTSALAESMDDVLKDCKLDRSRWKVVEWFKAEQFVRFYDSTSVTVTGPGRFDAVIYDYYYGNNTCISDCKLQRKKHYHSEKWGFNTIKSAGTLRSMVTKDLDENVVSSYDIPSNMQIESELNKKSFEYITMQKIKEQVKADKIFTKEAPSQDKPKPEDNYGKFAPLPQPIGSSDGEWIYLGRFVGPTNKTYLENILEMKPFYGQTAQDGVLDVYYNHTHDRCHYGETTCEYDCILKFVPLDINGHRIQRRGFYTELVDIGGGTKGAFSGSVRSVRRYDTATHELVETFVRDGYKDRALNPVDSYGYKGAMFSNADCPFWKAFQNSKCPGDKFWKH